MLLPSRYRQIRFHLVDIITIGYAAVLGAIIPFFAGRIEGWYFHVIAHAAYCFFALEIIRASQRHPQNLPLSLGRMLHPAIVMLGAFLEIARLQHMFVGSSWATEYLVRLDLAVFGVHPTVWFKQFFRPWLDEIVSFFRVVYYVVPFLILGPLILANRKREVLAASAFVMLAYCINYVLFFLFPAVNPRMVPEIAALDTTEYTGYLFGALEHAIQGNQGAVAGASFPSAHVTGTVSFTLVAYRFFGAKVGLLYTVICIGTVIGTVYMGFHHGADPIGGVVVALGSYPLTKWLLNRRGELPPAYNQQRKDYNTGSSQSSLLGGRV